MNFTLDEAIKIANKAVFEKVHRYLTDVEVIVFKGAWQKQEYDAIAAQHGYSLSYISQDVAPKLWKLLTEVLGEHVKKSNFKEALKRYWEKNFSCGDGIQGFIPPEPIIKPGPFTPDYYVERPSIQFLCYNTLLQPGSLLRIKAPNLMGKTSLITKVLAQVAKEDYQTVNLSFKLTDRIHFSNLDKFLRWLCTNISRELRLPSQLEDYWDESGMGSKVSCTTYFEEYLLAQTDSPLALCLDDVDLIFPSPEISEDFFGLLRSWHEKARSRPLWKKLRLIIVHSTEVYIPLNINQSPFNVGVPIELSEFTSEQVQDFAKQYGLDEDIATVEPLMRMVGGHPYLLQQAFSYLKSRENVTLDQILAMAPTEEGIYSHHLRQHWLNLQEHPELAVAFKRVVTATAMVQLEPMQAYKLQSMGLVKLQGNELEPRCNLYRQYFSERLGDI